jgi:hypothetical protein
MHVIEHVQVEQWCHHYSQMLLFKLTPHNIAFNLSEALQQRSSLPITGY